LHELLRRDVKAEKQAMSRCVRVKSHYCRIGTWRYEELIEGWKEISKGSFTPHGVDQRVRETEIRIENQLYHRLFSLEG
jgi:hypothetical protein